MMNNYFEVLKKDAGSYARIGRINSPRGIIETPVFMPVGTKASVKAVLKEQLDDMGCMIILSNLYHIYLSPGIEIIKKAGGIHKFSSWSRSILTDSGGFQVFSLSDIRKIKDDGVEFKSIIDGSSHFFTPEKVIKMQLDIGSDIMMVLDECSIFNADERVVAEAAGRTLKWARQSIKAYNIFRNNDNSRIFGIVQGGFNRNLRKYCAQSVSEMDFDGIALGGLSVGESRDITTEMMGYTSQFTDRRKPLYVMGLGDPVGILNGINFGVDMFDCVLPTRISRNGSAFTKYGKINIKNKKYSDDFYPIEEDCNCYSCRNYSKAYIKHLHKNKEIVSSILLSIHNINFLFELIKNAKAAISQNNYTKFKNDFISKYGS
jgi:queuine tRNA-ribosyltransferase